MALTVEDGSGVDGADALAELAFVDAWHLSRGNTAWAAAPEADREAAIRRATTHVSEGIAYTGDRTWGDVQPLSWPRSNVVDREGYHVDHTSIPVGVQRAVAEFALTELTTPGAMTPSHTPGAAVKREKVEGLEIEYANPNAGAVAQRPVVVAAMLHLKDFVVRSTALSGERRR